MNETHHSEKNNFNTNFGRFVRAKRVTKNWSQSMLAAQMGNNAQNISRLESGKISPSIYWINKLCSVFQMSLSDFFLEFEQFNLTEHTAP